MKEDFYFRRHPLIANILIIFIVGIIGVFIAYLWLNIFTRHGESDTVPAVENMSFTQAVVKLHDHGFRTDIRDSIYNEDIPPGYVVEQFPKAGSHVKPGRKIFLYINAVHPREVIIDSDMSEPGYALKGYSMRQGLAKLEELGFKKVNVVKVPGDNDRIIRLIANGHTVAKMEKVPVTSLVTVEVYDGMLNHVTDSLMEEEYLKYVTELGDEAEISDDDLPYDLEPVIVQ